MEYVLLHRKGACPRGVVLGLILIGMVRLRLGFEV
jgi:hypothetical protein